MSEINLMPATEYEEVAQNIQMIVSTVVGEVPLDRSFGVESAMLDRPQAAAQVKLTRDIIAAVRKFEPRAVVEEVKFTGELAQLKPVVVFKLK